MKKNTKDSIMPNKEMIAKNNGKIIEKNNLPVIEVNKEKNITNYHGKCIFKLLRH